MYLFFVMCAICTSHLILRRLTEEYWMSTNHGRLYSSFMRLVCDAPQIGRNQLPWKHDCIVYDGILYVYIY